MAATLTSVIADTQLRKREMEVFCNNTYPPPHPSKCNSLKGKPSTRTFKDYDEDAVDSTEGEGEEEGEEY